MAEEAKMVPKLRFKGFSEPWRQETPRKYLTESRIPGTNGKTARKLTVKLWGKGIAEKTESYSGSEKTKYYIRKAGQLMYGKLDFLHQAFGIVPNRLDGYQSTLDSPAFDISSEINSNFLLSEISRKEFYERLGKIANGSRKAKRIHVDTFFDMPMVIPKIKEQNQISRIIETTNSAITLHEEKLEQLKALKRGMLQDLFPDQGETTPVLRHEGFSDNWQREKSKVLFKNISQKGHPELPVLSATQKNGMVFRDDLDMDIKYDPTSLVGYKLVSPGNFIISLRSFQGGFELSDKKGIVSPAYTVFKFNVACDHDLLYWKYFFKSYDFIESLKRVTFGIRDGKSISFSQFGATKPCYPSKLEQQKIGVALERIDALLKLHEEKLLQLQKMKKFLLQNLFI